MPALSAGTKAPDFQLKTREGQSFSLSDALARGPVLLVFFKISCPTCQYALPFYERLFRAHKKGNLTMVGISQDNPQDTTAFAKEFGITFPLLVDNIPYPVSSAYGLTNVPTLFWINSEGEIEFTTVGWSKADFEQINRRLAEVSAFPFASPFLPGEDVRDYRGG